MSFEDEYAGRKKKKDPLRAFLPVIGLILIVCFAAISWVVHEPLRDALVENISDLPQENEEGFTEVGYVAGGSVFVILLMFTSLLYAAFAPKPEKIVSERELLQEKKAREAEAKARKKRKREMQQQMAKDRKNREG